MAVRRVVGVDVTDRNLGCKARRPASVMVIVNIRIDGEVDFAFHFKLD